MENEKNQGLDSNDVFSEVLRARENTPPADDAEVAASKPQKKPRLVWLRGKLEHIDDNRLGSWMISVGLITERQRNRILEIQQEMKRNGNWELFGILVLQEGYCSETQVMELVYMIDNEPVIKATDVEDQIQEASEAEDSDRIGTRMVMAGIITVKQRNTLLEKQKRLEEQGVMMRFADLAIQEGLCYENQLRALMEDMKFEKDTPDW